jgi:hypothetical protein
LPGFEGRTVNPKVYFHSQLTALLMRDGNTTHTAAEAWRAQGAVGTPKPLNNGRERRRAISWRGYIA